MDDLGELMVNALAAIVVIGALIVITAASVRWVFGARLRRNASASPERLQGTEASAQREELTQLKQRLAVLERIAVEKESSLEREFAQLRDG